jgi:hypothetical protein
VLIERAENPGTMHFYSEGQIIKDQNMRYKIGRIKNSTISYRRRHEKLFANNLWTGVQTQGYRAYVSAKKGFLALMHCEAELCTKHHN